MTSEQIAFLRELQGHPLWASTLKTLLRPPARYRPALQSEDETAKIHKLIYESGRFDENRALISTLLLSEEVAND